MVAALCYITWKCGLLLSFFMVPWILFLTEAALFSFFLCLILLLSFHPSKLSSYHFSPSSLQTAPKPFPFCGHIIFCTGLTKSTRWLCFLGTDTNTLIMTAWSTEGFLLTFLCSSYFRRLLPPGGHQWQKQAPGKQAFTRVSTRRWGPPTWEILHSL